MKRTIVICGTHRTVKFAARELARYLGKALGARPAVVTARDFDGVGRALKVGLCDAFDIPTPARLRADGDWVCIRPDATGIVLCGANPRSVLFAVYRYLQALGFRWIRPGKRGEIIPALKSPMASGLCVAEQPSYPYRTICIEGACSEKHVVDLIDWMAKQGMNGYFLQFEYGSFFWRNWYLHEENPYLPAEDADPARIQRVVERVTRELARRDMRFEHMGHGWTCAPLGIAGEGWDPVKQKLPAAKRKLLAQVNGKREFWGGIPLNTNLCYANPAARSAMVDAIVGYARRRPGTDALHVWLADGSNNNCECAACRKARPSDFYVDLLNEIDAGLEAEGLATKIVFLIYVDLLWPPVRRRIRNPDRFILMFAPITRSYLGSFVDGDAAGEGMAKYVRNKLPMPKNVQTNIEYLSAWQKQFAGDGFDFDYHLIWTCYADPGQFGLSRVLHKDIQGLSRIGLHGLNSCQNQRMSFPHNLAMDVMARTLWDKKTGFASIVRDSFRDAYGEEDGPAVASFFQSMSKLWLPFYEPVHIPELDASRIQAGLKNTVAMKRLCVRARGLVAERARPSCEAVAWSWRYLVDYLDLLDVLVPAFEAYLAGAPETRARFEVAFDFLWRNEKRLHPALDVRGFVHVCQWRIHEVEVDRKAGG